MQILSNESLSPIKRKVTIVVPVAEVEQEVESCLKALQGKVKLPGFRSGKVPQSEIKRRFGDDARNDALGKIIQRTYDAALKQTELQPVSYPQIEIVSKNPEEDLQYTATFEIYPEVVIGDLSTVTATRFTLNAITDSDVDEAIASLQKKHANWKQVAATDYGVVVGDKLTIDLFIKSKVDAMEKHEEGVAFELGSGFMWKEFEQPIYGHKLNDVLEFPIVFPEHHMDKDFAGKEADVRVTIKGIETPEPLSIDELVVKFAFQDKGGVEALRSHIKESMQKEATRILEEVFHNEIQAKLLEVIAVEVPQTFIDAEIQRRQQHMAAELRRLTGMKKVPAISKDYFAAVAKKTVAVGLILARIVEDNKLEVSPEELRVNVEEMAKKHASNEEEVNRIINWYQSNREHLNSLKTNLLEKKSLDFIRERIKTEDVSVSYKEAIDKEAALRTMQ